MRTWSHAQRLIRREAARLVANHDDVRPRQLIAAVGARAPRAVITSRAPESDDVRPALVELAVLASVFTPQRVLVAEVVPLGRGRGVLAAHDLEVVADGWVEVTRAWAWQRVLGRAVWLPAEVQEWRASKGVSPEVARIIAREPIAQPPPEALRELVDRCLAVGHRVRLAPTSAFPS